MNQYSFAKLTQLFALGKIMTKYINCFRRFVLVLLSQECNFHPRILQY